MFGPGGEADGLELRGVHGAAAREHPERGHPLRYALDQVRQRFRGHALYGDHDRVKPKPEAKFVLVHAEQGFTTNLPMADLLAPNVIFAYKNNGEDLTDEHGWPLRLVVPHLYFWKSAKWVRGLEFLAEDEPGFWEDAATTCAATPGRKRGMVAGGRA